MSKKIPFAVPTVAIKMTDRRLRAKARRTAKKHGQTVKQRYAVLAVLRSVTRAGLTDMNVTEVTHPGGDITITFEKP